MGPPTYYLLLILPALLLAALWFAPSHTPRRRMLGGITVRQTIGVLVLSAGGLVAIVAREGYSERSYPDPVHGAAVPTIGFGTTGPDVKMGQTTTPVKALERALKDVGKFEGAIKRCVRVPLHQYEYDAYVSLAYNVGPVNFCENKDRTGPSALVQRLNAGDYPGACEAILLYDRAGPVRRPQDRCSHPDNRTCRGLWSDRLKLHAQCMGPAQ